jgi:hypothetical protein
LIIENEGKGTKMKTIGLILMLMMLSCFTAAAQEDSTPCSFNVVTSVNAEEIRVLRLASGIVDALGLSNSAEVSTQLNFLLDLEPEPVMADCFTLAEGYIRDGEYSRAISLLSTSNFWTHTELQAVALYLDGQQTLALQLMVRYPNPLYEIAARLIAYDPALTLEILAANPANNSEDEQYALLITARTQAVLAEWQDARLSYEQYFAEGGDFERQYLTVLTQLEDYPALLEVLNQLIEGAPDGDWLKALNLITRAKIERIQGDHVSAAIDDLNAINVTLDLDPEAFRIAAPEVAANVRNGYLWIYPGWQAVLNPLEGEVELFQVLSFGEFVLFGFNAGQLGEGEMRLALEELQPFTAVTLIPNQ